MRDMSMMSPQEIATKYGGDKRKIGRAVQMGLLDPTAAAMAGLLIDRIRAAATQEQQPQTTVAEDALGERPMPYERAAVPSGGVASLPLDEDMVPSEYAGGGIVAFADRGFVETPGGFNVLEEELSGANQDEEAGGLGRARKYVDLYREMLSGAQRGPAYEEMKKFYEGSTERGTKAAERAKWATGLAAASELLSTRGSLSKALGAAGKVAAPGLQKAAEMEAAAEEAGIKGRLALEEKERAEELEAIKGGMGLYGKEREREIAAGKDLRADRYVKRFVAAAKLDPKLKDLPQEILEQMGEREFLNLSGAALMRGQAALGNVAIGGEEVERKRFGDAAKLAEETIFKRTSKDPRNTQYKELLKTDKNAALAYKNSVIRDLITESGGGAPSAAPAPTAAPAVAPAPKKDNIMFPSRGANKFEVKTPDGRTFTFPDQKAADAFKARIGG